MLSTRGGEPMARLPNLAREGKYYGTPQKLRQLDTLQFNNKYMQNSVKKTAKFLKIRQRLGLRPRPHIKKCKQSSQH